MFGVSVGSQNSSINWLTVGLDGLSLLLSPEPCYSSSFHNNGGAEGWRIAICNRLNQCGGYLWSGAKLTESEEPFQYCLGGVILDSI